MFSVKSDIEYLKSLSRFEQIVDTDVHEKSIFGIYPKDIDLDATREVIKRLIGKYKFYAHHMPEGNFRYKLLSFFIPEKLTQHSTVIGTSVVITSKFIKEELQYVSIEIKKESRDRTISFLHEEKK